MTTSGLAVVERDDRPSPAPRALTTGPRLSLPTAQELAALQQYGDILIKSGLCPAHIKTWQAAVVIMRFGHQLGVDEFTALQNLYTIGGKVAAFASLQHALILRDHGDNAILVGEMSAERCALSCRRRGQDQPTTITYTFAEAKQAGLVTSNPTWGKYPADMLFARAISRAGRVLFRDSTLGTYTPEEIGGNVVEVDGRVMEFAPVVNVVTHGGGWADAETGEIVTPAPAANGASGAMRHLHKTFRDRDMDHDACSAVVCALTGRDSLKDLSDAALNNAAAWASDLDAAGLAILGGYAVAIHLADSQEALQVIGGEMKAGGIDDAALRQAWKLRNLALKNAKPDPEIAADAPATPADRRRLRQVAIIRRHLSSDQLAAALSVPLNEALASEVRELTDFLTRGSDDEIRDFLAAQEGESAPAAQPGLGDLADDPDRFTL